MKICLSLLQLAAIACFLFIYKSSSDLKGSVPTLIGSVALLGSFLLIAGGFLASLIDRFHLGKKD